MISQIAAAVRARRAGNAKAGGSTDMEGTIVSENSWMQGKKIPDAEDCVKSGILCKQGVEEWQDRQAFLRANGLMIAKLDSQVISDKFLISEIAELVVRQPEEAVTKKSLEKEENQVMSRLRRTQSIAKEVTSPFGNRMQIEPMHFDIITTQEGVFNGRAFSFRGQDEEDTLAWIEAIRKVMSDFQEAVEETQTPFEKSRELCGYIYCRAETQMVVSAVITANFVCAIWAAQTLPPEGSKAHKNFEDLDLAFTIFFVIELAFNMYAHLWKPFWRDPWNCFDVLVVSGSLLLIAFEDAPAVGLLRLIRVLRVMRVFKRMRSLRVLMTALAGCLVPVANAFMILALFTFIYAVLGVEFFSEWDPEYFGNFSSALFTMFQTCTGDSWASNIARPLFYKAGGSEENPDGVVALFFSSYIIVVGTVLINVVIAVLLDEFISAVQEDKQQRKEEALKRSLESNAQSTGAGIQVLDPILSYFASFSSSKDLSEKIKRVYQQIDEDESGGISMSELQEGLKKMGTEPLICLSADDFESITEGGVLCNEEGEIDYETFEAIIRRQLVLYVQRHLASKVDEAVANEHITAPVLLGMKQVLIALEPLTPNALWRPLRIPGARSQVSGNSSPALEPRPHCRGVFKGGSQRSSRARSESPENLGGVGAEGLGAEGLGAEGLEAVAEDAEVESENCGGDGAEGLRAEGLGAEGGEGVETEARGGSQPLSHSATQPLSHSATGAHPLSDSFTRPQGRSATQHWNGAGADDEVASALSTRHSPLNTQHSALSTQHPAPSTNTHDTALNIHHSALSTQHSAPSTQHSLQRLEARVEGLDAKLDLILKHLALSTTSEKGLSAERGDDVLSAEGLSVKGNGEQGVKVLSAEGLSAERLRGVEPDDSTNPTIPHSAEGLRGSEAEAPILHKTEPDSVARKLGLLLALGDESPGGLGAQGLPAPAHRRPSAQSEAGSPSGSGGSGVAEGLGNPSQGAEGQGAEGLRARKAENGGAEGAEGLRGVELKKVDVRVAGGGQGPSAEGLKGQGAEWLRGPTPKGLELQPPAAEAEGLRGLEAEGLRGSEVRALLSLGFEDIKQERSSGQTLSTSASDTPLNTKPRALNLARHSTKSESSTLSRKAGNGGKADRSIEMT